MTETMTQVMVQEHGIYEVEGRNYLAISNTHIVRVGEPDATAVPAPHGARLLGGRGGDVWNSTMMNTRSTLAAQLSRAQEENTRLSRVYREQIEKYERLGVALLEQAEERDWCSEYDDFAQQWELPTRAKNFQVTVTLTVSARTGEDASDLVANGLHISEYTDGVVSGPEIDAEEEC